MQEPHSSHSSILLLRIGMAAAEPRVNHNLPQKTFPLPHQQLTGNCPPSDSECGQSARYRGGVRCARSQQPQERPRHRTQPLGNYPCPDRLLRLALAAQPERSNHQLSRRIKHLAEPPPLNLSGFRLAAPHKFTGPSPSPRLRCLSAAGTPRAANSLEAAKRKFEGPAKKPSARNAAPQAAWL
jgi:hypothetical protein